MRKLATLGLMLIACTAMAQQTTFKEVVDFKESKSVSELLEKATYFGLTEGQKKQIEERKEQIGAEFKAVLKDKKLSDSEKKKQREALAIVLKGDVNALLTDGQKGLWNSEEMTKKINKSAKKSLEYKLELLELEYETEVRQLENKYGKDKSKLNAEKDALKERYKAEKEAYKKQKEAL